MTDAPPFSHALRTLALSQRKPTRFHLLPDAVVRQTLAAEFGLLDLPHLEFRGEIRPAGRADFMLMAELSAEIVQACVVTLAPVAGTIRESVKRRYSADWHEPDEDESEVPEDDSIEPLGDLIDIGAAMSEALALALPLYPRAPGAEFQEAAANAPGTAPLTRESTRPFAGLADLWKKNRGSET